MSVSLEFSFRELTLETTGMLYASAQTHPALNPDTSRAYAPKAPCEGTSPGHMLLEIVYPIKPRIYRISMYIRQHPHQHLLVQLDG